MPISSSDSAGTHEPPSISDNVTSPSEEEKNPSLHAQTGLVLMTVFLVYMGQMLLTPIIAPLSRSMGMKEWHIGATISLAAITLALMSQFWGRRSQQIGAKKVLGISMTLAVISLGAFGAIAYLGTTGVWVGSGMIIGVFITRGLAYGASISAVTPAVQTYLVTHTTTEEQRVKALGGVGAAQGVSSIAGAIVGGVLAWLGGLMLPIALMPCFMIGGIITLLIFFRADEPIELIEKPTKTSYFDPRLLPFLIAGLMMFICFSSLQSVIGFAIQDRFHASDTLTAAITALLLTIMSVVMVITQGGIAPALGWTSRQLLRRAMALITVGFAFFLPSQSYVLLAIGSVALGVGFGMAMPGYTAGPTLEMSREEQGSLAGLINANNGMAYAVAPVLSTSLYGWNSTIPFYGALGIMALVAVFCYTHPRLRKG
ncbi:MAG: MFS transporter [Actinomycetaceae bacterium]|nr:MFS transporter [Actinomycetaceae bacterium]